MKTVSLSQLNLNLSLLYKFLLYLNSIYLYDRTHQLRVHMLHIGHPILGDPLYPIPDHTPDCSVTTTTTTSSKKKPRLNEPLNHLEASPDDHIETSHIAAVDECLSVQSSHHHSEEVVAISSKCYPRLCLHHLYLKLKQRGNGNSSS